MTEKRSPDFARHIASISASSGENKTSDNAAAPRQIVGPEAIRPGFVQRYDDVGLKCFGVLRLLQPAPESDSPLHARRLEIRWQPHVAS